MSRFESRIKITLLPFIFACNFQITSTILSSWLRVDLMVYAAVVGVMCVCGEGNQGSLASENMQSLVCLMAGIFLSRSRKAYIQKFVAPRDFKNLAFSSAWNPLCNRKVNINSKVLIHSSSGCAYRLS